MFYLFEVSLCVKKIHAVSERKTQLVTFFEA